MDTKVNVNEALQHDELNGVFIEVSGHLIVGRSLYLSSDVPFETLRKHVEGEREYSSTTISKVDRTRMIIIGTPGIRHMFQNYSLGGGTAVIGNATVWGRLEGCDRVPYTKKLINVWEISWPKSDGTLNKVNLPRIEEMRIEGMKERWFNPGLSFDERQESMRYVQESCDDW